jgi:uncharacterized protein with FMN-binding domain
MSDSGHAVRKKVHSKKVSRSLIALSSAAVLGVYSAGYMRTRAAAERFLEEPVRRRPVTPVAAAGEAPAAAVSPAPMMPGTAEPAAIRSAGAAQVPAAPPPARAAATDVNPAAAIESKAAAVETVATVAPSVAPAQPAQPAPLATMANATPVALAAVQQTLGALPAGLSAPPAKAKYLDGTYTGWGTCRHGDIQAKVVIADGKITSAGISQCLTRYSCSWISPLPPQVITRQSPETDFVSGATDSTNASYFAVVEALSQAKPK